MNRKVLLLLFGGALTAPQIGSTKIYVGFQRAQSNQVLSFQESIRRFKETPKEFLILFSRRAAFYSFPKTKENTDRMRRFLKQKIQTHQKVLVKYDAQTIEILSIDEKQ